MLIIAVEWVHLHNLFIKKHSQHKMYGGYRQPMSKYVLAEDQNPKQRHLKLSNNGEIGWDVGPSGTREADTCLIHCAGKVNVGLVKLKQSVTTKNLKKLRMQKQDAKTCHVRRI